MTTATSRLTTPPLSTLLTKLFAEAKTADAPIRAELSKLSPAERTAFLAKANTDYREFYGRARELFLPVSEETGTLLYLLARTRKPHVVVEFGTSFGISTLHLAAALEDNGAGRIISSELEPSKAAQALKNLEAAGLAARVEIRVGDAIETLGHELGGSVDLVLLDGAKVLYPRILALLEPHLSSGALLVADNADDAPEYLKKVRDPKQGYLSLPMGPDVEVSMRL